MLATVQQDNLVPRRRIAGRERLPHVRLGDISDETEVVALVSLLHAESGLFDKSDERIRDIMRVALEKRGGIIGLIGQKGTVEGMVCLLISKFWYCDSPHLEELFVYVRPEYRRSLNAKALMLFAKSCSDNTDLPLIIGVLSNINTAQKIKLYERQFGKPVGCFFVYNTKWNNKA